jgi:hypothetical protein
LKEYSFRRYESFERSELLNENVRLSEKIIALETERDRLVDGERSMQARIEYWSGMYVEKCKKFLKLQKIHKRCPKKSIILYR